MGHFGVDQAGSRCWPAVRRVSSFVSIFAADIEDNGACFIVRDQGGPKARLRLLRGGGRRRWWKAAIGSGHPCSAVVSISASRPRSVIM
jgi:hypothetical protein